MKTLNFVICADNTLPIPYGYAETAEEADEQLAKLKNDVFQKISY